MLPLNPSRTWLPSPWSIQSASLPLVTWSHAFVFLNCSSECVPAVPGHSLNSLTFPFLSLLPSLVIPWHSQRPCRRPLSPSLPPSVVPTQKAHPPLKLRLPPPCYDPRCCALCSLSFEPQSLVPKCLHDGPLSSPHSSELKVQSGPFLVSLGIWLTAPQVC